jgi:hypothetical protein
MANGPMWNGKIYKRAKFGDRFDSGTVKGAQRRQQIARQRRKWAEQDRRWREQQEAEWPPVTALAYPHIASTGKPGL